MSLSTMIGGLRVSKLGDLADSELPTTLEATIDYVVEHPGPVPLATDYLAKRPQAMFQQLQRLEVTLGEFVSNYPPSRPNIQSRGSRTKRSRQATETAEADKPRGSGLLMIDNDTETFVSMYCEDATVYHQTGYLTDIYQESVRTKAYNRAKIIKNNLDVNGNRWRGDDPSINNIWKMPAYRPYLRQIITDAIESYVKRIGPVPWYQIPNAPGFRHEITEVFYRRKLYVSQYYPSWGLTMIHLAKSLMGLESSKQIRILDPFAGWGDRMIAAIKTGDSYVGFDPNLSLHAGYQQIRDDLVGPDIFSQGSYVTWPDGIDDPKVVEKFEAGKYGRFAMVLTSPTYGGIEIYDNNSKRQSSHPYLRQENGEWIFDWNGWCNGFYIPMLRRVEGALLNGGVICMQINARETDLQIKATIETLSVNCKYLGYLSVVTATNRFENRNYFFQKRMP